jgi:hypothetical protein
MDNGADDFYRGQTATVVAATTAVAIVTALILVFLV